MQVLSFCFKGFTSAGLSLAALFSNLTNSKLDFCTKLMEKFQQLFMDGWDGDGEDFGLFAGITLPKALHPVAAWRDKRPMNNS